MSTLFLVTDKKGKKLSEKTKNSLTAVKQTGDEILFKTTDEFELYHQLKDKKTYDFVCLIPNNAEINENFADIFNDYQETRDEKIIYLPLVVLTSLKTKGILNTCIWNKNLSEEPGVLTPELALAQIDTTLFGALIPYDLFFDEENYNKDLKYYQHFYFLNKITSNENNIVFGIPKTTLYTDIDLSFSDIPNDEKIKFFKQAKEINVPTETI